MYEALLLSVSNATHMLPWHVSFLRGGQKAIADKCMMANSNVFQTLSKTTDNIVNLNTF